MDDVLSHIEARLGHPLGEPGQVIHLNETPPSVIEDARRLSASRVERMAYLWHVLAYDDRPYLAPFIRDCIEGDVPVATWCRGRTVTLAAELPELVAAPAQVLLAPLQALGSIRTLKVGPYRRYEAGAPVVVLPDVDYRWRPGPGLRATVHEPDAPPAGDPVVAFRRWLAVWLEWQAGFVEVPTTADVEAALRLLVPGVPTCSEDARVAAQAFLVQRARGEAAYAAPDALLQVVGVGLAVGPR